jgi:hypothetical protein
MNEETTANAGGQSAGGQSVLAGQSETGAERVTGSAHNAQAGQSDQTGQSKGNPGPSSAVQSPQNVGLAKVFAGQSEAGAERVTGGVDNTRAGQSDQAGQPKGNQGQKQSNDSILPTWVEQLPKKLTGDPDSAARLATFKSIDDLVKAYLDVSAKAGDATALPGKDATPKEVQAFYERLGKPKEARGYSFAKNSPDFAQVAFAANLSESQADALYKASLAQLDDARAGVQAALAQDFQATDILLQKEYGEKYGEAIALMTRGMGNNPKTGELSPIGRALVDAGLAGKPEIVRAFIELGRATSEGTAVDGRPGSGRPQSVLEGRGFDWKDNYLKE